MKIHSVCLSKVVQYSLLWIEQFHLRLKQSDFDEPHFNFESLFNGKKNGKIFCIKRRVKRRIKRDIFENAIVIVWIKC